MDSQNEIEEFSRPGLIKLTAHASPEYVEFLKEWAAAVPTLYFLDICVVNVTKLTQDQLENIERKAEIVKKLRFLDRPANGVSYLFALMEKVSDTRGTASDEELEERILDDLAALRAFFVHARVCEPDEFVIQFLRELRRSPIELERPRFLQFLTAVNDSLDVRKAVKKPLRFKKAIKIVALAQSLDIYHQHPVVTIVLACLYGNSAAKNLLKLKENPAEFNAENSLADIMAITRFAKHQLFIDKNARVGGRYKNTSFITDDDGLIGIIGCFQAQNMTVETTSEGATTRYTLTVELQKLLTEIGADEYEKIVSLLTEGVAAESKD
jgi:hypothetical protein